MMEGQEDRWLYLYRHLRPRLGNDADQTRGGGEEEDGTETESESDASGRSSERFQVGDSVVSGGIHATITVTASPPWPPLLVHVKQHHPRWVAVDSDAGRIG